MTALAQASVSTLQARAVALRARLDQLRAQGLKLDLTRGKPGADQLALSNGLESAIGGDFRASDGTDVRNYGGLRGIPEARDLGATLLSVDAKDVMAAGNSSLTLMYQVIDAALHFGLWGDASRWRTADEPVKFLCPAPGYDRHFTICQSFGIEMIAVSMDERGPNLDEVEAMVAADASIKGIWCVPKYSNPTGCVYADAVVARLARLPASAGPGFLVCWDNAYAVHDLVQPAPRLAAIGPLAEAAGQVEHIVQFGSTSKITFAGAGVAFMAAGPGLMARFEKFLGAQEIGPDKVNQLRHARFLRDGVEPLMRGHATLIKPKFDAVLERLETSLGGLGIATWTVPKGGYFISFDTLPGLARRVVELAKSAGVTLTPAGATFPYGRDPEDKNIRIAPTFPSLGDVEAAADVFTLCVEVASIEHLLTQRGVA
ncbi:MAG: aminotransferase [Gammaproteobacteria bacterium]|nr:aminotransferase [Gammaproteobacteria bacterium]